MILVLALLTAAHAQDCPPQDRLTKGAALGTLSAQAVGCLDAAVRSEDTPLAERLGASRLLIQQSFASGARTDWSRHVAYHLASLDPDEADLAVRYADHLLAYGAPSEALKMSLHALEHRYRWDDRKDQKDRLNEALALRARAARATLDALPADTATLEKRALEGRVRLYAIEWLALADQTKRDPTPALQLCVDTGWEAERCRERAAGIEF